MEILGIDPGTQFTGWCFLSKDKKDFKAGLLTSKKDNWIENCRSIFSQFDALFLSGFPTHVIIELPEYWASSIGLSARESGSIMKLAFLCGGLYYTAFSYVHNVYLISPSSWKGQMSKDIVRHKLEKIFPSRETDLRNMNHNTIDAIGIAYYANIAA